MANSNLEVQSNTFRRTQRQTAAGRGPAASQETPNNLTSETHGWTPRRRIRLTEIEAEERARGKGFMERLKKRWNVEYPDAQHTAKNLVANARRFKVEQDQHQAPQEQPGQNVMWTSEMKVTLIELEQTARSEGKGFMARLKARWDEMFTQYRHLGAQCLRDNASRFSNDQTIKNLLLVRQNSDHQEDCSHSRETSAEVSIVADLVPETSAAQQQMCQDDNEIHPGDEPLRTEFLRQIRALEASTTNYIDRRERLGKTKVPLTLIESANRILLGRLRTQCRFEEITDSVYAMASALKKVLNNNTNVKTRPHENRRIVRCRQQLRELRKKVARASNEIHRRQTGRKMTHKERYLVNIMREQAKSKLENHQQLLEVKEKWLDEMRAKRVKLAKMEQKETRVKNNRLFERSEGRFYQGVNKTVRYQGETPSMEKFTEFWGGIWENDKETKDTNWMHEVGKRIQQKVTSVEEFQVNETDLGNVIRGRKNWTAPGVDGIENYWWKIFRVCWQPLSVTMNRWVEDQTTIPSWLALGRTVLIPKAADLSSEKDYRPITCLNTSYKMFTSILGNYMRNHAQRNGIWDKNQMGTCSQVLGTVDQLLIDNCIMDEVRNHKRNLAVAYYDYQKAYDRVHHEWMLKVYNWMGFPEKVVGLINQVMKTWKTKLEVSIDGKKVTSRLIDIKRGFLQGDSFSPVGFCLTEVPIAMLLEDSEGYLMGPPGSRLLKKTHSLFIDDLKIYQHNHEKLKVVNDMIVKASLDTGACYGVKKCAEIVFIRGKMVKGEGLEVLEERMKALDPESNESYKFLGCEQAEKINTDTVFERVKDEVERRMAQLTTQELHERNLIKAINTRVIPVAGYVINVCDFTKKQLDEIDKIIKQELR